MSSPTLDRPSDVLERGTDPEPENQLVWSCIGQPRTIEEQSIQGGGHHHHHDAKTAEVRCDDSP